MIDSVRFAQRGYFADADTVLGFEHHGFIWLNAAERRVVFSRWGLRSCAEMRGAAAREVRVGADGALTLR